MEDAERAGSRRFPKRDRLRTDREYREVVRKGERATTPHFTVYRDRAGGGATPGAAPRKVGISVGRRVGGAVLRNRVKRLLREFCRLNRCAFPEGTRTAIVARKAPAVRDLASVSRELLPAIERRWGKEREASRCGQRIS
jgi:ribonuclease P protein component